MHVRAPRGRQETKQGSQEEQIVNFVRLEKGSYALCKSHSCLDSIAVLATPLLTDFHRQLFSQRCLHCPNAYHLTCIAPLAKYNELALLCHEHAATSKLPHLNMETSMQREVEEVDAAVAKKLAIVRRKSANVAVTNPFFPGLLADRLLPHEEKLLSYLEKEHPDHEYLTNGLTFCLPIDIKEEVRRIPWCFLSIKTILFLSSRCLFYTRFITPSRHPTGAFIPFATTPPIVQSVTRRVTKLANASQTACQSATSIASTDSR